MPRLVQHSNPSSDTALDYAHYREELEESLRQVVTYAPGIDAEQIRKAFEYSWQMHEGQKRKSGEPYIEHPVQVLRILVGLKMDQDTLVASLLHDVVEDSADRGASLANLQELFGDQVAVIVNGVTKLSGLKFQSFEHQQSENYRKMLLSMARDIRVIFVKFADRLHNMRTIAALSQKKAERIARETIELYAPLAHRFGIGSIKWELEDLSLKVLDPEFYRSLEERINLKYDEREDVIEEAVAPLRSKLEEYGKTFRIFGRPKHFYSVYHKIHKRNKSFEEILDLFAVRIIVPTVSDCYFALGVVHNIYTPITDRFSDYIASPKSNGYQSLHTKVVGPRGRTLEVQIRTEEMNRVAEYGLAAHWLYKEGGHQTDEQLDRISTWIKQVLDEDSYDRSSQEFLEGLKINLYQDDIFVFTPKGDLFKLPAGSTPIDFAFAVHTSVGLHCIGAKVNAHIVPLDYQLTSGCTVEVITSRKQTPTLDWLKIVRTHKARSRIKRWLRESQWQQSLELGEEVLRKESARRGITLRSIDLEDLAQGMGYRSSQALYVAIGNGDLPVSNVIRRLEPEDTPDRPESLLMRIFRRGDKQERSPSAVRVHGMSNMVIHFSKCCQPVPGDDIIGLIVTGKGVKVHRRTCPNINQLLSQPERIVEVEWDAARDQQFNARIILVASDRRNLLHDVAEVLAKMDVNIMQFNMRRQDDLAIGRIILEVKNLAQLTTVLKRLRQIREVIRVQRHDQGTDW